MQSKISYIIALLLLSTGVAFAYEIESIQHPIDLAQKTNQEFSSHKDYEEEPGSDEDSTSDTNEEESAEVERITNEINREHWTYCD